MSDSAAVTAAVERLERCRSFASQDGTVFAYGVRLYDLEALLAALRDVREERDALKARVEKR